MQVKHRGRRALGLAKRLGKAAAEKLNNFGDVSFEQKLTTPRLAIFGDPMRPPMLRMKQQ